LPKPDRKLSMKSTIATPTAQIVTRHFRGNGAADTAAIDLLSPESQAALRQFSIQRLMGYGLTIADAIELRGRVAAGEPWREAADALASECLTPDVVPASLKTRADILYRASALLRMSQVMMVDDSEQRRAIFQRAVDHFAAGAEITKDRSKLLVETPAGPIAGWLFPAIGDSQGAVILIGGVEGWAMDFAALSTWLAARGIDVYAIDGPGQGESRLMYGHYFDSLWMQAYSHVIGYAGARAPGGKVAFVGNSMGGTFAIEMAAVDKRIVACCSNGGPRRAPNVIGRKETKVRKVHTFCGPVSEEEAQRLWEKIDAVNAGTRVVCPLLIIQGGSDPLVSDEEATEIFESVCANDKTMLIFSDGDHCIYNHAEDKHNLIGDWILDRLKAHLPEVNG
jgi:alpha-beta hydrolase superfamily lysophospholipase